MAATRGGAELKSVSVSAGLALRIASASRLPASTICEGFQPASAQQRARVLQLRCDERAHDIQCQRRARHDIVLRASNSRRVARKVDALTELVAALAALEHRDAFR